MKSSPRFASEMANANIPGRWSPTFGPPPPNPRRMTSGPGWAVTADGGVVEGGVQVGGGDERAGGVDVVEGIDPEAVACDEELAPLRVGDGEREHSGEMVDDVRPPLLEAAQDDFGIGVVGD